MRILPAALAVLATGLAVTGCAGSSSPHPAASRSSVSVSSCGAGWTEHTAGPQHIRLHNTDSRAGEAQLIDPRTQAVFADVEPIGPQAGAAVDVDLGAGPYAWRCLMEDEAAVDGPTVVLARHGDRHHAGSQAGRPGRPRRPDQGLRAVRLRPAPPGSRTRSSRLRADLARPGVARRDWLARAPVLRAARRCLRRVRRSRRGDQRAAERVAARRARPAVDRLPPDRVRPVARRSRSATLRTETRQLDKSVSRLSASIRKYPDRPGPARYPRP